jgi:hypothetical protein
MSHWVAEKLLYTIFETDTTNALECLLKPMIAKPWLIAKAFSDHAGCAALAIKK